MTSPEQSPPSVLNEKRLFEHQELVEFDDGVCALKFSTPGDVLELGEGSRHKYAKTSGFSMAILKTNSGNTYANTAGKVLNENRQAVYQLDPVKFEVTIGEQCILPGVGITTQVESVYLRYMTPPSDIPRHKIDEPSPFDAAEKQIEDFGPALKLR